MAVEYKDFRPEVKALDEKGRGQAIIATLNTVDRDLDVTSPGAFGEQRVKLLVAHDWKQPVIGDAVLHEVGSHVIADFQIYTNMQSGREVYESLKSDRERFGLQEWSYGYQVLEHERGIHEGKQVRFLLKVKAHEISPVVVGAGVGTGTLMIKESAAPPEEPRVHLPPVSVPDQALVATPMPVGHEPYKRVVSPHQTPITAEVLWNPFNQRARVRVKSTQNYFAAGYLLGYGADLHLATAWIGLHHEVKEDGEFGPANLGAIEDLEYLLHLGIFPESWREPMWEHLAQHKKDAGVELTRLGPPDLYTYPLVKREQYTLRLAKGQMQERLDIHDIKASKGMTVTESHRKAMQEHRDAMIRQCEILAIAPMQMSTDAAVQELADREFVHNIQEKLNQRERDEQNHQEKMNRAMGEAFYQRYLAREKNLHSSD